LFCVYIDTTGRDELKTGGEGCRDRKLSRHVGVRGRFLKLFRQWGDDSYFQAAVQWG